MTATTALTAQNTQGVTGIHETPSEFVKKCIDACAEDVGIDVVKTGKSIFFSLLSEVDRSRQSYASPLATQADVRKVCWLLPALSKWSQTR
jgi:hydroxymethylpyrimidine/phosphomethylpyrimidine kinase